MDKLVRYGHAHDRATEHDPRMVTLTDDEAVAILRALTKDTEGLSHEDDDEGDFLLFVGDRFYPSGGAADFAGCFLTLKEAQQRALTYSYGLNLGLRSERGDWAHGAELTDDGDLIVR